MKRASDFTRELASGIADLNTKRTRRVEAGVNLLFALAIGVSAGLLAVFELGGWPW